MGRRTKLTPRVHNLIVQYIRGGAFDYVAAQATGIDPGTFRRWMNRGEKYAKEPFRTFCIEVRQARAQARVVAENKVFADAPFNWLRYGPGRERPGEPGWTDSRQVEISGKGGKPLSVTHHFDQALKRAYKDDSTGQVFDNGGEGKLPKGPDQELSTG